MHYLATRIGDITTDDILLIGLPVLFGLLILSWIAYSSTKHKQNAENSAKPVLGAIAKVVDKQQIAPNTIAFEVWVMFETESGERIRVVCKANNNYIIGDRGYLKYQGTKLLDFERFTDEAENDG